jgi:hypothetical protein
LLGKGQAGTYIFPQIFLPFGQNATFLPAYTVPYSTYTIRLKKEMKLYHSPKDSYAGTYTNTYIHFYIDRLFYSNNASLISSIFISVPLSAVHFEMIVLFNSSRPSSDCSYVPVITALLLLSLPISVVYFNPLLQYFQNVITFTLLYVNFVTCFIPLC